MRMKRIKITKTAVMLLSAGIMALCWLLLNVTRTTVPAGDYEQKLRA